MMHYMQIKMEKIRLTNKNVMHSLLNPLNKFSRIGEIVWSFIETAMVIRLLLFESKGVMCVCVLKWIVSFPI